MNNYFQEKHAMVCQRVLDNGIDVFYCPACGRKMLIQWTPIIRQVVIEAGDETVIHSATPYDTFPSEPIAGVPQPDRVSPEPVEETDPEDLEVQAEWEEWLQAIGFESWWTRGQDKFTRLA